MQKSPGSGGPSMLSRMQNGAIAKSPGSRSRPASAVTSTNRWGPGGSSGTPTSGGSGGGSESPVVVVLVVVGTRFGSPWVVSSSAVAATPVEVLSSLLLPPSCETTASLHPERRSNEQHDHH